MGERQKGEGGHRPECWCNGTGFRRELGAPCNLPQLTDAEHAYVTPPGSSEEGSP